MEFYPLRLAVLSAAACATAPTKGNPSGSVPATVSPVTISVPRLAPQDFVASEMHWRYYATLKAVDHYWISTSLPPRIFDGTSEGSASLPLIDLTESMARVVIEDSKARIAIWIDRRHMVPTVSTVVKLDQHSENSKQGVWLKPGVPLNLDGKYGESASRVTVSDGLISASGSVVSSILTTVWQRSGTAVGSTPAVMVKPYTAVYLKPDEGSFVLATVVRAVHALVLANSGTWSEVLIYGNNVEIRGYIPSNTISGEVLTDVDEVDNEGDHEPHLPSGACLFAGLTGQTIGIAKKDIHSLRSTPVRRGWWTLHVRSPWGVVETIAHDRANNLNNPVWVMCPMVASTPK